MGNGCVSSSLSEFGVSGAEGVCYGCDIRIQYRYARINHLCMYCTYILMSLEEKGREKLFNRIPMYCISIPNIPFLRPKINYSNYSYIDFLVYFCADNLYNSNRYVQYIHNIHIVELSVQ